LRHSVFYFFPPLLTEFHKFANLKYRSIINNCEKKLTKHLMYRYTEKLQFLLQCGFAALCIFCCFALIILNTSAFSNQSCITTMLFIAALWNRAGHYIFILWFLLSFFFLSFFFFPRLISAVADWMSTILPHMVWP